VLDARPPVLPHLTDNGGVGLKIAEVASYAPQVYHEVGPRPGVVVLMKH
jgi:hypothetical protein